MLDKSIFYDPGAVTFQQVAVNSRHFLGHHVCMYICRFRDPHRAPILFLAVDGFHWLIYSHAEMALLVTNRKRQLTVSTCEWPQSTFGAAICQLFTFPTFFLLPLPLPPTRLPMLFFPAPL